MAYLLPTLASPAVAVCALHTSPGYWKMVLVNLIKLRHVQIGCLGALVKPAHELRAELIHLDGGKGVNARGINGQQS